MAEQLMPERRADIRRGAEWVAANYVDSGRGASRMLVETADVLGLLDALDAAEAALARVSAGYNADGIPGLTAEEVQRFDDEMVDLRRCDASCCVEPDHG